MRFSEDHIQFLDDIHDTIREMIDAEFDRRARQGESNSHPENPPPELILSLPMTYNIR
jgi:hypothetical protein